MGKPGSVVQQPTRRRVHSPFPRIFHIILLGGECTHLRICVYKRNRGRESELNENKPLHWSVHTALHNAMQTAVLKAWHGYFCLQRRASYGRGTARDQRHFPFPTPDLDFLFLFIFIFIFVPLGESGGCVYFLPSGRERERGGGGAGDPAALVSKSKFLNSPTYGASVLWEDNLLKPEKN